MASSSRSDRSGRNAPRLRLRSSHSARIRIQVSHRGSGSWKPPGKEDDAIYESDLVPTARPRED
jgi:hypothetical protein